MTDDHTPGPRPEPEHDRDVLARLRAVDPVPRPVSQASDGPVRATFEEIIVSSTQTDPRPGEAGPGARRPASWLRDPRILAVAAALVLAAGIVGALALGGDDPTSTVDSAAPATEEAAGDQPTGDEPLPDDADTDPGATGSALTSCVAQYSLETLTEREYAFDGTVTAVDGRDMTFAVNEWFAGGEGDTVTLDHGDHVGMLFAPDGPALEPGTRVLAAGDGGFVWSCGFTQLHDPALADQWRSAFPG